MPDPAKDPACALLRCRGTSSRQLFLGCWRPIGVTKAQTAGQKPSGRLRLLLNKRIQPLR
jgi:hypothetical protein